MQNDKSGAGYGNHGGDESYGKDDLQGQDGKQGGDHEQGKPIDGGGGTGAKTPDTGKDDPAR